jgi:hypothetical protein
MLKLLLLIAKILILLWIHWLRIYRLVHKLTFANTILRRGWLSILHKILRAIVQKVIKIKVLRLVSKRLLLL